MHKSNNHIGKIALMLFLLATVVSCGGSKTEGQGFSGGVPVNDTSNLGLEGSGNYSANSVQQYRELVRQGSFPRSNFRFGDREEYVLIQADCGTVFSEFLFFDDVPSNQCAISGSTLMREYTDGRVSGHQFGASKAAIINGLLSLIDRAADVYLVDYNNQIIFGGNQSSRLRIRIAENNEESTYYLDLRRPISMNPAIRYYETVGGNTDDYSMEIIDFAQPQ